MDEWKYGLNRGGSERDGWVKEREGEQSKAN